MTFKQARLTTMRISMFSEICRVLIQLGIKCKPLRKGDQISYKELLLVLLHDFFLPVANRRLSLLPILMMIAADECCGQDSAKSQLNSVEINVRHEHFKKNPDRTFVYFQYGRTLRTADVFMKVLRYSMDKNVSYLFELESYLKLKKKGYWYFDAAYSGSDLLPNYRLRAEIFHGWRRFEYSGGVGVVKPQSFRSIPFFTGTIGYYFSDYFIYARPTFSYVDEGFARSIFIQARRYLNKTDFLALSALRGADTGTERTANAIANTFGLDTFLVRLNAQVKNGTYKFGAGFDYGAFFTPGREEPSRFVGLDVFLNRTL